MAFPPSLIGVVHEARPVLQFGLVDFRDDTDPSGIVDITDYVFELVVRSASTGVEVFRLDGSIVSETLGLFKFELGVEHTTLAPGDYDAELRWWDDPDPVRGAPLDAVALTYRVTPGAGR